MIPQQRGIIPALVGSNGRAAGGNGGNGRKISA